MRVFFEVINLIFMIKISGPRIFNFILFNISYCHSICRRTELLASQALI